MEVTPRKESVVRKKDELPEIPESKFSAFFTENLPGDNEMVPFSTLARDYKEIIESKIYANLMNDLLETINTNRSSNFVKNVCKCLDDCQFSQSDIIVLLMW